MILSELTDEQADALLDRWTENPNRGVQAVSKSLLIHTQTFLYEDRVQFYMNAIQAGMFPPAVDGLRTDNGQVFLIDGHHRSTAWIRTGFSEVPIKVQEVDEP